MKKINPKKSSIKDVEFIVRSKYTVGKKKSLKERIKVDNV